MSELFEDMMEGLKSVEAYLQGERDGFVVHIPAEIDVAQIRKKLRMTQAKFCRTFGFSLDTVKHWEGGRRAPESAARAFLTVISRDPSAVIAALHDANGPTPKVNKRKMVANSQTASE